MLNFENCHNLLVIYRLYILLQILVPSCVVGMACIFVVIVNVTRAGRDENVRSERTSVKYLPAMAMDAVLMGNVSVILVSRDLIVA